MRAANSVHPKANMPIGQSIDALSERRGGCLIWTGSKSRKGYGTIKRGGEEIRAHRWVWESENGPVPDGMMIDHMCHNPACVEISHLRIATNQQNQMNRGGPNKGRKHELPRGVYMGRSERNPYIAIITKDRKLRHLGSFATVEEALVVRRAAEVEMFGAFAGA